MAFNNFFLNHFKKKLLFEQFLKVISLPNVGLTHKPSDQELHALPTELHALPTEQESQCVWKLALLSVIK